MVVVAAVLGQLMMGKQEVVFLPRMRVRELVVDKQVVLAWGLLVIILLQHLPAKRAGTVVCHFEAKHLEQW